jgi:hypothetical protein
MCLGKGLSLSLSLSLSLARARDSISVSLSLDLSLTERVVDRCGRTGHAQCYDDGAPMMVLREKYLLKRGSILQPHMANR